jgi:hypothetical protein
MRDRKSPTTNLSSRAARQFRRVTPPASEGQVSRHACLPQSESRCGKERSRDGRPKKVISLVSLNKRPWLCAPTLRSNNALQLTSGGSMRAARASFMRRLQLSAVLYGHTEG